MADKLDDMKRMKKQIRKALVKANYSNKEVDKAFRGIK